MSKFLNLFGPAAGGAAGVLAMAYVVADQFVVEIPSAAPVLIGAASADSTASAESTNPPVVQVAAREGGYGLGRPALPEEIAAWDVDVRPDGQGLPPGSGDVWTGEEVFADYCAACHGDFAEGVDNWPVLAGGFDTLADKDPVKTVGSYWPHLSTVWDYVNRSMPFGGAQTLTPDEVYAIVAYILYSNDKVDDDFVLSNENFAEFEMYNAEGFIIDDRAETEYPIWRTEPCMEGCKDSVEITMRASILDVTPEEEGMEGEEEASAGHSAPAEETTQVAAAEPAAAEPAAAEPAAAEGAVVMAAAALDPELVKSGEKVFRKCKSCHMVGDGAADRTGPMLNGIMGASFAKSDSFSYSSGFQEAKAEGRVWDEQSMTEFLRKPKDYMKGTKMGFAGLKKDQDIEAVIAYLRSFDG